MFRHQLFLSTPSVWRATFTSCTLYVEEVFLSTPSVWRATFGANIQTCTLTISIHALRVEGDRLLVCFVYCDLQISIHALRVEGDTLSVDQSILDTLFLSTPSVWRATYASSETFRQGLISIHALRVEGDAHQS